ASAFHGFYQSLHCPEEEITKTEARLPFLRNQFFYENISLDYRA
ncbi:MAG: hypothetical protein US45_C0045G0005, partial [Candidatus Nomurabacteria bacterium GW2011_GWA1_37_20]